ALLDKNGLSSPSSHISLAPDQWRAALDAAPVIGHRYLVLAWIPAEERRTLDDYKRWAERLNRAGTEAKAAGLQFAYHNHDFEFAPLDGSCHTTCCWPRPIPRWSSWRWTCTGSPKADRIRWRTSRAGPDVSRWST